MAEAAEMTYSAVRTLEDVTKFGQEEYDSGDVRRCAELYGETLRILVLGTGVSFAERMMGDKEALRPFRRRFRRARRLRDVDEKAWALRLCIDEFINALPATDAPGLPRTNDGDIECDECDALPKVERSSSLMDDRNINEETKDGVGNHFSALTTLEDATEYGEPALKCRDEDRCADLYSETILALLHLAKSHDVLVDMNLEMAKAIRPSFREAMQHKGHAKREALQLCIDDLKKMIKKNRRGGHGGGGGGGGGAGGVSQSGSGSDSDSERGTAAQQAPGLPRDAFGVIEKNKIKRGSLEHSESMRSVASQVDRDEFLPERLSTREAIDEAAVRVIARGDRVYLKRLLNNAAYPVVYGRMANDDEFITDLQRLSQVYEAVGDEIMTSDNLDTTYDDLITGVADHVEFMIRASEGFSFLKIMFVLPAKHTDKLARNWIFRSFLQANFWGSAAPYYIWFQVTLYVVFGILYSWLAYVELAAGKSGSRPSVKNGGLMFLIPIVIVFTIIEVLEFGQQWAVEERRKQQKLLLDKKKKRLAVPAAAAAAAAAAAQDHEDPVPDPVPDPTETTPREDLWEDLRIQCRTVTAPYVIYYLNVLGCPRGYIDDPWNWVDMGALVVFWTVLVWSYGNPLEPGSLDRYYIDDGDRNHHGEKKADHAVYANLMVVGVLLFWLKLLGFFRFMHERLAAFIYMLVRVVADLELFLVVLLGVFFAFTQVFYLRLSRRDADRLDYDDGEEAENPFSNLQSSVQTLYIMGVTGDVDNANFPRRGDLAYADIFLFIVAVVLLNVVIAIVTTAYDNSMATSGQIFWRLRLRTVATPARKGAMRVRVILRRKSCRWRFFAILTFLMSGFIQVQSRIERCIFAVFRTKSYKDLKYIKKQLKRQLAFMDDADDSEDTLSFRRLRRSTRWVHRLLVDVGSNQKLDGVTGPKATTARPVSGTPIISDETAGVSVLDRLKDLSGDIDIIKKILRTQFPAAPAASFSEEDKPASSDDQKN